MTTNNALSLHSEPGRWVPIVLATLIFSTLSLLAAVTSEGFLEADACTHYQYAKFAFAEPHYFVNVWGRPLVTALYRWGGWLTPKHSADDSTCIDLPRVQASTIDIDFGGSDLKAFDLDHFLGSVGDTDPAVFVDGPDIARLSGISTAGSLRSPSEYGPDASHLPVLC